MPRREDIKKVMIIGSGPIIIGQACEFDYSGTQACKALRQLGYEIVLVNSNPATIMTDPGMADVTYLEPLTVECLEQIIEKERPDAILPNLGGQTGLNLTAELARKGILAEYGVRIVGVQADAIERGEDRIAFKETPAIRFEGNGYSEEWVREAKRRGLLNLRRTPEALDQLKTPTTRKLFATLGILSEVELESRYHVRLERYSKDMLIEMHTMRELVETQILPAALAYLGVVADAAQKSKAAGLKINPAAAAATALAKRVTELQKRVSALHAAVEKAEGMHETPAKCAQFVTSTGADCMAAVREVTDALELAIGDDYWPLPRYREMVFPV